MGIKIEWQKLLEKNPKLLTVFPTDTVWENDPSKPDFSVVLSDQTASMQQMNFSNCGLVLTSGALFKERIIKKFAAEHLRYHADHIILLWDKSCNASDRRIQMYSEKRYQVPDAAKAVPKGKIRGYDGRFYYPHQAPIPKHDPETGFGVKREHIITESHMHPLPQLLNASWTKNVVAEYICKSLWDFAAGRPEHIVFDTPLVHGDDFCNGQMKCNQPSCVICPMANVPRHAESDLLYLFHIRHLATVVPASTKFLVRGSNDRDLFVVLSFPFDQGLHNRIWWCKGTNDYGISPTGEWVKPGPFTGKPKPCHEFLEMKRFVAMIGGPNNDMLLTRLFLLFFFGGDYCETPKGLTQTALFDSLFSFKRPIITHSGQDTLALNIAALHYYTQFTRDLSTRSRSTLEAGNLHKCTMDAFYSLAYYTAFHKDFELTDLESPVGPDLESFECNPTYADLFQNMLRPAVAAHAPVSTISYSF